MSLMQSTARADDTRTFAVKMLVLLVALMALGALSLIFVPRPIGKGTSRKVAMHVIKRIRAPQAAMAIASGGALALAGALMQTVLDNALASPFTLGVSSAASFGASVAITASYTAVVGVGEQGAPLLPKLCAFIASSISVMLLLAVSATARMSKKNIILVGMALNFLFSSLNTLLQYYARPDVVYQIAAWTGGTLVRATMTDCAVLAIATAAVLCVSIMLAPDMGIIMQGERVAVMQGVNVNAVRTAILLMCSMLSTIAVSMMGVIGFVGLVAPHFARLLRFKRLVQLLNASAVIGALLLLAASAVSTVLLYPIVLPVGSILSLVGIPFLLSLILSQKTTL